MEELLALVQTLQGQVAALTAAVAAASAPVAVPAPTAAPAPVAFADTPQMLGADGLIDYSSKRGSDIYTYRWFQHDRWSDHRLHRGLPQSRPIERWHHRH